MSDYTARPHPVDNARVDAERRFTPRPKEQRNQTMKTLMALLCATMLTVSAPALSAEKDAKGAAKPAAAQAKSDDKISDQIIAKQK